LEGNDLKVEKRVHMVCFHLTVKPLDKWVKNVTG